MAYKFIEGYRLSDYVEYCAICGSKTWHSDMRTNPDYSGRDGLRVCPDCLDPVDYGLVPFLIPTEKPVPTAQYLLGTPTTNTPPVDYVNFDYENYDPASGAPLYQSIRWGKLTEATWATLINPWGQ